MTNKLFEHNVVPYNSDVSPVENLANEVLDSFDKLDIHLNSGALLPSIGKVLGNFALADIAFQEKSKEKAETFSIGSNTSEVELSEKPVSNSTVQVIYQDFITNNTKTLTEVSNTQAFTSTDQFRLSGRVLTLSGDFEGKTISVRYTSEDVLNVKPNVLFTKDGEYIVGIEEDDEWYTLSYNTTLSGIDSASVFVLAYKDGSFYNIETSDLIVKNSSVSFTTNDDINSFEFACCYVINTTIAQLLEALYLDFKTHTHADDGNAARVSHSDVINRFKNTDRIFYKDGSTPNYEHPQYLNREGYDESLNAVYGNAMLGDILLSAIITGNDQVYKSVLKDSYKIMFGDPVAGSSLYYDSTLKSLSILTGAGLNGLNIYAGLDEIGLGLNAGSTYISETEDGTVIKGKGNSLILKDSVYAEKVSSASVTTEELSANLIKQGSVTQTVDGKSVTVDGEEGSVYEFKIDTALTDASVDRLTAKDIEITSRIIASEDSQIENDEGSFKVSLKNKSFTVETNTGSTSCLSVGNDGKHQKIYSSNYIGGTASPSDSNFFYETPSDSATYFIKALEPVLHNNKLYVFRDTIADSVRVDSLKDWVRSEVYAGDVDAYSIDLSTSNSATKNGLKIGDTRLSVIGIGLDCPQGTTVLESSGTVHIVKPMGNEGVDCSDVDYQNLNTGSLQVFGELAVDAGLYVVGDAAVGENLTTTNLSVNNLATIANLTATESSLFAGQSTFTGVVKITNNLSIEGSLGLSGSLNASDAVFEKYVSIGDSLTVAGQSIFNNNVVIQGNLYTSDGFTTQGTVNAGDIKSGDIESGSILAQGTITSIGSITAEGPVDFKGNLTVAGSTVVKGSSDVEGELTTDSLYVTSDTTLIGRLTAEGSVNLVTESFTVGSTNASLLMYGNLQITGGKTTLASDASVQGAFNVSGKSRFTDSVDVTGTLSTVSLVVDASATVKGTLTADSGDFKRKVYFQDGIKAAGLSEVTDVVAESVSSQEADIVEMYVKTSLTMGPDSTLRTSTFETNSFHQMDASLTSSFEGAVEFNRELRLSTDGLIVGNPVIKMTRNTSGAFLSDTGLILGNNSVVKAVQIFANKGTPAATGPNGSAGFVFSSGLTTGSEDDSTGIFATDPAGTASSELEVWIDGARKYVFYKADIAYNASVSQYGKAVVTLEMMQAMQAMLERKIASGTASITASTWPVGSIYQTTSDKNPYDLFGFGSWVRYAAGRTLVGRVTNNASEQGGSISGGLIAPANWNMTATGTTYGAFTHAMTIEEMPRHTHVYSKANEGGGQGVSGGASNSNGPVQSSETGGGAPHNNVQPSVIVNMWNRFQ